MGFLQVTLSYIVVAIAGVTASKIQWLPCSGTEFNTSLTLECGTWRVPLDYTQPNNNQTLDLEILRIPAAVKPSRGSILFNFGGPGGVARQDLVDGGAALQQ